MGLQQLNQPLQQKSPQAITNNTQNLNTTNPSQTISPQCLSVHLSDVHHFFQRQMSPFEVYLKLMDNARFTALNLTGALLFNQRVVLSVIVNYHSSCWGFYKKVGQQEVSLFYSLWLCACVPKLTVKSHPFAFLTVFFNIENKLFRLHKRMKYATMCICQNIQVCRK